VIVTGPSFHTVRRSRAAARRLYCFPYAGGAMSAFRPLASAIREDVELCVASLPGRGPRLGERPEDDMGRLVSPLADGVMEGGSGEFALLGHSMGALVAFEVARELRRRGFAPPLGLVVSGARAPHFIGHAERERRSDLPREKLLDYLRSLGGTPSEVLDSSELMDLLLPAIRADIRICETYRYLAEPPLSVPLWVLFGEEDPEVRPQHVAGWRLHTTSECVIRGFTGGHFFIERHGPEVGRILTGFLDGQGAVRAEALHLSPRT
jgi:medium-chain acyl-[acyl-carrier-protein] hydrolase